MTRAEHEDAILAMLRAALPEGVQVDSVPKGLDDPRVRNVRDGAVWVVYAGGQPRPGEDPTSRVHAESWVWSVLCLAKTYRSEKHGAATALDLLEQAIAALDGAEIEYRAVTRLGDQLLNVPEEWKLMGYEAQFAVEVYAQRG